jgi:hypothetical protein
MAEHAPLVGGSGRTKSGEGSGTVTSLRTVVGEIVGPAPSGDQTKVRSPSPSLMKGASRSTPVVASAGAVMRS